MFYKLITTSWSPAKVFVQVSIQTQVKKKSFQSYWTVCLIYKVTDNNSCTITGIFKQFRVSITIRFTKTLERCFVLVIKLYLQFLGYEIRNPDAFLFIQCVFTWGFGRRCTLKRNIKDFVQRRNVLFQFRPVLI